MDRLACQARARTQWPMARSLFLTTNPAPYRAVQFAVMRPAERDREFIADLLSKSARLRKAQMVRVAGLSAVGQGPFETNGPTRN